MILGLKRHASISMHNEILDDIKQARIILF